MATTASPTAPTPAKNCKTSERADHSYAEAENKVGIPSTLRVGDHSYSVVPFCLPDTAFQSSAPETVALDEVSPSDDQRPPQVSLNEQARNAQNKVNSSQSEVTAKLRQKPEIFSNRTCC